MNKVAILFANRKSETALIFYFLHSCGYSLFVCDVLLALYRGRLHGPLDGSLITELIFSKIIFCILL